MFFYTPETQSDNSLDPAVGSPLGSARYKMMPSYAASYGTTTPSTGAKIKCRWPSRQYSPVLALEAGGYAHIDRERAYY